MSNAGSGPSAYADFLARKQLAETPTGIDVPASAISAKLFPFQRDVVRWALKRGRAALFEECGLGKTIQQLEWGRHVFNHTGGNVLILAPLAVAQQTAREGEKLGLTAEFGRDVTVCRRQSDVRAGINITNYEMLGHFDPATFAGVGLDESSMLKSFAGSTCQALIQAFRDTPFKLCCTATPAPNDHTELANHCEFLGIKRRQEMLTTWFVHDSGKTQDWRLKGHAEAAFWAWLSTWAVFVRRPSDLGYDDDGFALPPLRQQTHIVDGGLYEPPTADQQPALLPVEATTLTERRFARLSSLGARLRKAVELITAEPGEPWLLWCDLNRESGTLTAMLHRELPGAVEVRGSDHPDSKERSLLGFADGSVRYLVTKPSIAGFGLNWQHCARVLFVGLSDSYEQRYQAIRRCWRFGQTRPVHVHDILGEHETAVLRNLERKHQDAERLAAGMRTHARPLDLDTTAARRERTGYAPQTALRLPSWLSTRTHP